MKHLVEITEHDTWSRTDGEVAYFKLFDSAKEARDYARSENDKNDEPTAPETYYTAAYMGEVADDYKGKKK